MKQFSPAAFSVWHTCLASFGEAAPARSRTPPEKGTISLFVAAMAAGMILHDLWQIRHRVVSVRSAVASDG